jgi:hypothetical protein
MHQLTGTWTANLEKSRRHPNHQFRRVTMRFDVEGDAVSLAFEGVNAAGAAEEGTRQIRADGAAHPEPAAAGVLTISTIDARMLEVIATKDGATVGRACYEVSEDGRSLISTTSGVDGSGRPFDQVIVFDRAS